MTLEAAFVLQKLGLTGVIVMIVTHMWTRGFKDGSEC